MESSDIAKKHRREKIALQESINTLKTELAAKEAELVEVEAKLDRAEEMKDEFIALLHENCVDENKEVCG
jgi:chromosome segregation ATPase